MLRKLNCHLGPGNCRVLQVSNRRRKAEKFSTCFIIQKRNLIQLRMGKLPEFRLTSILTPDRCMNLASLKILNYPTCRFHDMVVDVNPRISAEQGLEIEDLGSADGWDIGGCL